MAEPTDWISWEVAAELTGLPVPTIEHAVRVNRIRRRPQQGQRPTLDAASVVQWAAWYRDLQAHRASSPRRRARSTTAPLPPGEWLTTAEAAEILAVQSGTVLRHVELGNLVAHRGSQVWVSEESVRELAEESSRWVSWRVAVDILGCTREDIPRLVAQGHLEQRPAHRTRPSLSLASVEAYAPRYAAERLEAQRLKVEAERQKADSLLERAARNQPPPDGDVWLDVSTAALVLGLCPSRVLQLAHAELLPASLVGRRWWLRRRDVEQAAAVRAFTTLTLGEPATTGHR